MKHEGDLIALPSSNSASRRAGKMKVVSEISTHPLLNSGRSVLYTFLHTKASDACDPDVEHTTSSSVKAKPIAVCKNPDYAIRFRACILR